MKRTLISGVGLAVLLRLTEPVTAAELPVAARQGASDLR
jgi:hypothetical protein